MTQGVALRGRKLRRSELCLPLGELPPQGLQGPGRLAPVAGAALAASPCGRRRRRGRRRRSTSPGRRSLELGSSGNCSSGTQQALRLIQRDAAGVQRCRARLGSQSLQAFLPRPHRCGGCNLRRAALREIPPSGIFGFALRAAQSQPAIWRRAGAWTEVVPNRRAPRLAYRQPPGLRFARRGANAMRAGPTEAIQADRVVPCFRGEAAI
mmetsp:Transcript_98232/g.247915  ORF Transcript_98232/g.247915 Transcript_98232/m.247915 type:complete len:209 (+) Transcript_98232:517-1143(+)